MSTCGLGWCELRTHVLNQKIRGLWDDAMQPVGRRLARSGIGANAITLAGVALQGVVAYEIIRGSLFVGGLVAIVAGIADTLDGAVAKAGGASRFGALLDSTADRLSDALFFAPVAWLYAVSGAAAYSGQRWVAALALATLVASYLVSYVKARAEGLGYECNVGIVERAERLILIILGLLLNLVPAVLVILGLLSVVTVVQRLAHVRAQARRRSAVR
jgi:CDP-diacylglycerol---glycerol-3-phosphate 3-phosphatidyltransferase